MGTTSVQWTKSQFVLEEGFKGKALGICNHKQVKKLLLYLHDCTDDKIVLAICNSWVPGLDNLLLDFFQISALSFQCEI